MWAVWVRYLIAVRVYRPRNEILDGTWKLPEARSVQIQHVDCNRRFFYILPARWPIRALKAEPSH